MEKCQTSKIMSIKNSELKLQPCIKKIKYSVEGTKAATIFNCAILNFRLEKTM